MVKEVLAIMRRQIVKKDWARMLSNQSSRKDKQRGWQSELKELDEVGELAREHRPDESGKGTLALPKSSETGGGRSREFDLIMIGRLLWWAKPSFSGDRCSSSYFTVFSGSQKINNSLMVNC
jgi:hypothetical protein